MKLLFILLCIWLISSTDSQISADDDSFAELKYRTTGGLFSLPFGYFVSDDISASSRLIIRRNSEFFCQVKISIMILTLENPNSEGICDVEYLTFSGHQYDNFTICGTNFAQHVYLRFKDDTDIVLDLEIINANSDWVMQIEQIMCFNADSLAPEGCLQYYKKPRGIVTSFGFDSDLENDANVTQISNLSYNICFEDAGFRRLLLGTSVFSGLTNEELQEFLDLPGWVVNFILPPNLQDLYNTLEIPNPQAIIEQYLPFPVNFGYSISGTDNVNDAAYLSRVQFDADCPNDYLDFGMATLLDGRVSIDFPMLPGLPLPPLSFHPFYFTRMCGYLQDGFLENPGFGESMLIRKTVRPYTISVITDHAELPSDTSNKGFRFIYSLESC